MLKFGFILIFTLCLSLSNARKTINNHLSNADLQRLQSVFRDGLSSNDIQSVYYGAINYKGASRKEQDLGCDKITKLYKESKLNEFEKNFYLAGVYKALTCPHPIAESAQNSMTLNKEFGTSHEMYYNYFASRTLAMPVTDAVKAALVKNIQAILKKDDSLTSLGFAFHVAAELGAIAIPIADWLEGTFAQADEIDGKLLQFEGGLSITALLLNGAFKLTSSLNKPAPISEDQAVKFTAYLLSRRSVQVTKGASVLLEALQTISKNKQLAPVCIQVIGNGQLQPDIPVVNVKIVDALGNALSPAVTSVSAVVTSKPSNTVLQAKTDLVPRSSDRTIYSLDLTAVKPVRGSYIVEVQADTLKQTIPITVLGKVKVSSLEIGVGEVDSTSAIKKESVDFKKKLGHELNADAQQKVVLRAVLVDETNGKPLTVHQAFVRLENKKSKEEIIFVAEQDSSKAYKFDMDIGARSSDFGHKSGVYTLEFIVGDSSLSNSFKWLVADIQLKFTQEQRVTDNGQSRTVRPEIIHQFREPEKRPARFVSDLFTGLCAAPLLILFYLWSKLNVNVSNFPFSLSALGFHLGFGGILGLFGVFFWKLNMFDTIRYLIPLALFTFFCGNRLLRAIAAGKS